MKIRHVLLALASALLLAPIAAQAQSSAGQFIQSYTGSAARSFQDKNRDIISVKDFGARGNSNGSAGNGTNDTTAIQAALTNAPNGTVYFPCGTYRITASITGSTVDARYHLKGEGQCSKIFLDAVTALPAFSFAPTSLCTSANLPCLVVEGLNFIAPTTTTSGNRAIQITNNQHARIVGNHFVGYRVALSFATSYGAEVEDNSFYGTLSNAVFSGASDSSFNAGRIVKNRFYSNGATTSDAAISIGPSNGGLVIENNNLEGNYAGIVLNGGHGGASILGNYLEGQTSFDLYFNNTNYGLLISGNRIGSGLTTAWANVVNSRIENNIIGGAGGTISCDNSTSLGNWVTNNRAEGGATFTCVDGSNSGAASYSGLMVFSNTTNATGANTGAVQIPFGGLWVGGQVAISGNLLFPGFSSGLATFTQQSAQGTPTITIPTGTGTIGVSASSPLALNAGTGNITCATCGVTSGKVSQFAATTSTELAGVISDETGSGALVFATSPTLVTPVLGAATATSLSGATIYGGAAAAAQLVLQSTSSGSPSGDSIVLRTGGAAALTIDQFKQAQFESAALFPNNNGIYFKDTGGTHRSVFFMSAANVAIVKVAVSGGTLQLHDSGFNSMLTIADGGAAPVKFASSGSFIANGSVATTMTSLGPAGANTTIQEWLQIQNPSGTVRYVPLY
jgi:hypothetical protein